jgi:hypothetical protein
MDLESEGLYGLESTMYYLWSYSSICTNKMRIFVLSEKILMIIIIRQGHVTVLEECLELIH